MTVTTLELRTPHPTPLDTAEPAVESEPAYPAFDKMTSKELLDYAADIDKAHKKHMTYIRALAKAKAGLE